METLKVLDLFSGIGGFSLGLERAGMKTVTFCEIDPFCRRVLQKHWPDVPIHEDVKKLNAESISESVDLICGGYPCQPFSFAGKRRGAEDDRHLWPEYLRLIQEIRPRWIIAENVAGHINMGLDEVLSDLESENYQSWTFIIPACAVDAQHRRDRVWIIGNAIRNSKRSGRCRNDRRQSGGSLRTDVRLWPTPHASCSTGAGAQGRQGGINLQTAVKLWPTPCSSQWKGTSHGGSKSQKYDNETSRLKGDNRLFENGASGQLNPVWVEWLMGFPLGWTDLDHSETQLSHKSRK